jgi:hypothetical protein
MTTNPEPQGHVPASPDDPSVVSFARKFGIRSTPVYLDYTNFDYAPKMCHFSAKHRALTDGGKRIHGWALWQFGGTVVGDHHSVWEAPDGRLVDVTPPNYGAHRVLFVRDDSVRIEPDVNGNILFFTNWPSDTPDPQRPYLWNGVNSEFSNWPCSLDKKDMVEYCAVLEIPVTAVFTDDEYG